MARRPVIEKNYHVFLGIIPYNFVKHLFRPLKGVSSLIIHFFSDLPRNLKKTDIDLDPEDYITTGLVSYTFFGVVFGVLIWWLATMRDRPDPQPLVFGLLAGFVIILLFLILLVRMPSIQSKTRADDCDQYLLYALKDVVLQLSSGGTLFSALREVAKSGYGEVSKEFDIVVRKVGVGLPMRRALEEMTLRNDSDYLKKTAWQMINNIRAGADLQVTLGSIIKDLDNTQKTKIMNYARELNLWSLVYMMFAVAIPTIGSTMLVILSTFAGFGVTKATFISFVVLCFIVQFIMMNFVKARRPVVQF